MTLGREIHHGARTVCLEQLVDQCPVADIAVDKDVPRVIAQRCEIAEITGVSERVQIDDRLVMLCAPVEHEVGADKSGSAGNEDHGVG